MDKNIIIDLIKLEVLNNSDKENVEALQYLKRNDEFFPWKELGEYQNLIAILSSEPVVRQIKTKRFTQDIIDSKSLVVNNDSNSIVPDNIRNVGAVQQIISVNPVIIAVIPSH